MSIPAGLSRVDQWLLSVALIFIIIIAVKTVSYICYPFFNVASSSPSSALPAVAWLKKKGLFGFLCGPGHNIALPSIALGIRFS